MNMLYRAKKNVKDKKWIYGYYAEQDETGYIIPSSTVDDSKFNFELPQLIEIDTDTLCMSIGKADIHGEDVYENDFVYDKESDETYHVVWDDNACGFIALDSDNNPCYMDDLSDDIEIRGTSIK